MRPAVFLDRDGTLIEEVGNLGDPAGVVIIPGVPAALRSLAAAGYALVVVSNQGGIGRGLFTEAALEAVRDRTVRLLEAEGASIDAWYHCPHHPEVTGACACRKPAPGMLLRAADELELEPGGSWMVGDHLVDVQAGLAAGARPIKVRTGHGLLHGDEDAPAEVPVVDDLAAAAKLILSPAEGRASG